MITSNTEQKDRTNLLRIVSTERHWKTIMCKPYNAWKSEHAAVVARESACTCLFVSVYAHILSSSGKLADIVFPNFPFHRQESGSSFSLPVLLLLSPLLSLSLSLALSLSRERLHTNDITPTTSHQSINTTISLSIGGSTLSC